MAPYAAFHDAHVLTNPSADDLRDASEVSDLHSLTIFDYRLGSLDPIARIVGLESLKMQCSADITTFLAAGLRVEGVGFCKRCGGRTVLLTGAPKRARKWLCPKCNEKKLAEHVRRWDELKNGL